VRLFRLVQKDLDSFQEDQKAPIEFGTGTGKTATQGRIAELSMEGVDSSAIVPTRSGRLRLRLASRSRSEN
jgi:hypothetical protein